MKQQSKNKAKRWLTRLGGGVIVLCLAACGFWYWINIPPQIDIPNPAMPNPNGYDYFVRATEAYEYDSKGVDEITDSKFVKGKKYPLAAKEAWLKKNAKAFHLLSEGLKYPSSQPPIRSYESIDYSNYAQFRSLTRGLVVESHARGKRGDWNGAVQSLLDDFYFGNQIGRGGPLMSGLVSVATQSISLRALGDIVSQTDATIAKMAAANIEKIYEQRYPLQKTLQEEKWKTVAQMLVVMENPSQQLNSRSWQLGLARAFRISLLDYPKVFVTSKRQFIHDLTKKMDAEIEDAQQPYIEKRSAPTYRNPLVKALLPGLKRTRWNWARGNTAAVAVMTMFALHAYKLDNGHYPKNLKALVPTYLNKVPIDPFDGIAPIQYEMQGEKYILWSIGPDGVDNLGTPITNKNSKRLSYRNWSSDSKGDVVAGKNTP